MIRFGKLILENFCGFESAEVDFSSKISILQGPNGGGAAAILKALRVVLLNDVLGVTSSIRDGADMAVLSLEVFKDDVLYRVIRTGGGLVLESEEKSRKISQDELYTFLGVERDFLIFAFDDGDLLRNDLRQRLTLFRLFGGEFSSKIISDYLVKNEVDETIAAYVGKLVHKDYEGAMRWIERRLDYYSNAAKQLNLEAPDNFSIMYRKKEVPLSQLSLGQLRKDISQLQSQRDSLLERKGRLAELAEQNESILLSLKIAIKGFLGGIEEFRGSWIPFKEIRESQDNLKQGFITVADEGDKDTILQVNKELLHNEAIIIQFVEKQRSENEFNVLLQQIENKMEEKSKKCEVAKRELSYIQQQVIKIEKALKILNGYLEQKVEFDFYNKVYRENLKKHTNFYDKVSLYQRIKDLLSFGSMCDLLAVDVEQVREKLALRGGNTKLPAVGFGDDFSFCLEGHPGYVDGGEFSLLAVLVRIMAVKMAGFPVMVLDDLSGLDEDRKSRLLKYFHVNQNEINVIIHSVRNRPGRMTRQLNDTKIYYVDNFEVRENVWDEGER